MGERAWDGRESMTMNDLLRSTGVCVVNVTKGKDAFTCVSRRGSSVVDIVLFLVRI